MLQFILGGVGSGKTTRIEENIKSCLQAQDARITLIVPEQFTFTCQKNILALTGPEKMRNADVLSFTSLGEMLIGKPALFERHRLSDTCAAVLMSLTLKQVKKDLVLYGRSADRPTGVREFLSLSSEMKQNLISPADLRRAADSMEEGLLKAKLSDIALILEKYDEKVQNAYFNAEDLLSELCRTDALDAYFHNRTVFIDSFRGFTAAEYQIIERILVCADNVYVALCADDLENADDITDFFAKTKNTGTRIKALAQKNGVQVLQPEYLSKGGEAQFQRYKSPELSYLEYAVRSPAPAVYGGSCDNITLCKASDISLECEYVAATIKKLIRVENYRYRDIAVIARNIGGYRIPLTTALKKFGIKVYEDYRKSIDVSPVINAVSAAIRACADNFSADSLMRYIKTGLTGLTTEQISLLDNYCYVRRIGGGMWLNEWTGNPDGFVSPDRVDEDAVKAQLKELNALREAVITPVARLKESLRGGVPGTQAAEALWKFIENINLSENVRSMALSLSRDGEENAVQELGRMWSVLTSLIDELFALLKDETVTALSLADIFDLMVSSKTIGDLPSGLDDITIGSADRIRISSPRAVFVIGANEGVFPPDVRIVSSLTAKERVKLEKYGISLANKAEWKLAEENIIAYCSLCCAREKLFVTCSATGRDGGEMQPGAFYKKIKACIPSVKEEDAADLNGMYYIEEKQPAFEQLAKSTPGVLRETLVDWFSHDAVWSGRIASLQRARGGRNFRILSPDIAAGLFGRKMMLSASGIEQYHKCAFSYFCKYGLRVKPRVRAALDIQQVGNVNHKVLERIFSENTREELLEMSDDELRAKINAIMDSYLESVLESPDDQRFLFLYDMLRDSVFEVVRKLIADFEHSSFVPADFELEIGDGCEIPAYTPDGDDSVAVRGTVDRVDAATDGERNYYRIIDYKTKGKDFDISKALSGLNLQMLVYLFALWQGSGGRYGKDALPAGVLYYAASNKNVSAELDSDIEKLNEKKMKEYKVSGILLRDANAVKLMKTGDGGLVLPAKISEKDGSVTGTAINIDGLAVLKKRIDRLLSAMADRLRDGRIDALPFTDKNGKYLYCKYCELKPVCGFEDSMESRRLPDEKPADVISNLEKGGDDDGCAVE